MKVKLIQPRMLKRPMDTDLKNTYVTTFRFVNGG